MAMSAGMAKMVTIPAANRPFELGMLYDCRNDALIVSDSPWSPETLTQLRQGGESSCKNCDLVIEMEDNFKKKSDLLNFTGTLKLSIMSGLVKADGSANYLTDSVSSARQERVSAHAKYKSAFKRLVNPSIKIDHPEILESNRGTHYVAGITYGANAVFVFDKWHSEERHLRDLTGSVNAVTKAFNGVEINGEATSQLKPEYENVLKGFKCTFHGDIKLNKNPVTLEDALEVYRSLPSVVGEGLPIEVTLEPVEWLTSKTEKICLEISADIVEDAAEIFEDIQKLRVEANDMLRCSGCKNFPGLVEDLNNFLNVLDRQKQAVQLRVKQLLPEIRSGATQEAELVEFMNRINSSPVGCKNLKRFLEAKGKQIKALTALCDAMPEGVEIVAKPGAFESILLNAAHKFIVSYTVSTALSVKYLVHCLSYIEDGRVEDFSWQELLQYEENVELDNSLIEKSNCFRTYHDSNYASEESHCRFIVMESRDAQNISKQAKVWAKMQLYKENTLPSDFSPVGKPGKPAVSTASHDQIQLELTEISGGTEVVNYYEVEYGPERTNSVKLKTRTEGRSPRLTITNLHLGTRYNLRYRGCADSGRGPWSDFSTVATKMVSAPQILRISLKGSDQVCIEWQKPAVIAEGKVSSVTIYMQSPGDASWTALVSPKLNKKCPQETVVKVPAHEITSFKMTARCSNKEVSADSNIVHSDTIPNHDYVQELNQLVNNLHLWIGVEDFPAHVASQLSRLEHVARHACQEFCELLKNDEFSVYWTKIVNLQPSYTSSQAGNMRFYLSRILSLKSDINFLHKQDLLAFVSSIVKENVDVELELSNCAKNATQVESTEQVKTLLSTLQISAKGAPAMFQRMVTDGKFSTLFNYLLEKQKEFSRNDAYLIKHHLKNILKAVGDSDFLLKRELLTYLNEDIDGSETNSFFTWQGIKEVFTSARNYLSRNTDVRSRFSNLEDYFSYIASAEAEPLETKCLLDAQVEIRQAIANQENELTFFDVMQLVLDSTINAEEQRDAISATASKFYCNLANKEYTEFKRCRQHGKMQLQCHLLKLAIKYALQYAKLPTGSSSTLKEFQDRTFDKTTRLLRNRATEDVSKLLRKFAQVSPYDFEFLVLGLSYLQNGDFEDADTLERLTIPNLSMLYVQADAMSQSPKSIAVTEPLRESLSPCVSTEKRGQIERMLETLNLCRQKSISLKDVMKYNVVSEEKPQESTSLQSTGMLSNESCSYAKLPMLMLRKILMMDYNGRDEYFTKLCASEPEVNVLDFLLDDSIFQNSVEVDRLSPLDVLLLTYNHCHPMLQQILMEKLFVCKLAVPFIHRLNDGRYGIPSWALRSITIDWKDEEIFREKSAIDCAVDVISFVRIGRPKFSKSDLLNFFLYDNSHKPFFSHSCTAGSNARVAADGLVEAAWYSPSDKVKNHLKRNTMILNLRGNAVEHAVLTNFLTQISSLLVVVVSVDELLTGSTLSCIDEMLRYNDNLLILLSPCTERTDITALKSILREFRSHFTNESFAKMQWEVAFSATTGTKKIIPDLKVKMLEVIIKLRILQPRKTLKQFIEMGRSDEFGFVVDEDDTKIKVTREQAENVIRNVRKEQLQNVRLSLLPLQGIHWKTYSHLVKEYSSIQDSDARRKQERKQVQERNEQLKVLIKQSKTGNQMLQGFISYLLKYASSNDDDSLMFFLQWLKLFFDERSREHLPALAQEYRDVVKQLNAERKNKAPDLETIQYLENQVKEKELILSESSLGLEHLMREIAQIYEAVKEFDDGSESHNEIRLQYEALPEAAAKLLLRGFPLELMDGDVANVPLTWIRSVLDHAQKLVGNKKVFVLSVLGIQSSGKSTLLNTMFGLKFAVSAGRCTRGIFMQLIPVDCSSGYNFDYLLVLDTEGLRSSELQSQHHRHDNELATLVIGLGDLTIINIKGEDLTEVKDILEIVVQAFLKMKVANARLNLKQSCIFVHQNVSAVNAKSQMERGHKRLQDTLDEMTAEAARQVNKVAIHSFNQVINYDGEKHILFFSDLWKGDPPMAPANPGYSICANDLGSMVMEAARGRHALLYSFSNFAQHVDDMWSGVKSQDFLFTFRNSLEIRAFDHLEDAYSRLQLEFAQFTSKWVLKTALVRLSACSVEDELDHIYNNLRDELSSEVTKKGNECLKQLEAYFDSTDDLSRLSLQWKEDRSTRFSEFIRDSENSARQLIVEMKKSTAFALQKKKNSEALRPKILAKARQFAKPLKDANLTDELLEQKFAEIWASLGTNLIEQNDSKKSISKVLERLLVESMPRSRDIVRTEYENHPISQGLKEEKLENAVKSEIQYELLDVKCPEDVTKCRKDAVKFLKLVFSRIDAAIHGVHIGDEPFQESFARDLILQLLKEIGTKNAPVCNQPSATNQCQESPCKYKMPDSFTAKVLVTAARYMNKRFEKIQEEFERKHGVEAVLRDLREEGFLVFKLTASQTIAEVSAAKMFWLIMSRLLNETIVRKIQDTIPNEVKQDFCLLKHHVIKKLLIDLASDKANKEQRFANFTSYINDAASFALTWLTNYTNNKYFLENEGKTMFGNKCAHLLDRLLDDVVESVEMATETIETAAKAHAIDSNMRKPGMHDWVETFCEKMRAKEFAIQTFVMDSLTASTEASINFKEFRSYIWNEQEGEMKALRSSFHGLDQNNMNWASPASYQSIFDYLWGCRAQCPFCKEPCRFMSDHDRRNGTSESNMVPMEHMCIQHRPQSVGGCRFVATKELAVESCNTMISKDVTFRCLRNDQIIPGVACNEMWHPFKEYKKCATDWEIAPIQASEPNLYWQWFLHEFQAEIKDFHSCNSNHFDPAWSNISLQRALASLDKI